MPGLQLIRGRGILVSIQWTSILNLSSASRSSSGCWTTAALNVRLAASNCTKSKTLVIAAERYHTDPAKVGFLLSPPEAEAK
ncbi:hypothetical protein F5Y14DRAFT_402182 [Nemania sp. NC0429]|nr:hypothetical protein F5Y14DRAFT_402182 [Nemania sp. NC0429]